MTFDYSRLATMSATQLRRYGKRVLLRDIDAGGAYDPEASSTSGGVGPTEHTRYGLFGTFGEGVSEVRGSLVVQGDKRFYMEPGIKPAPEDLIIDGEDEYHIVTFEEINPAGTALLYDIHLRK